jgi:hypothetical protein
MKILLGYFSGKVGREDVGFEVLTEAVMKSYIFWDTVPCSPLKVS